MPDEQSMNRVTGVEDMHNSYFGKHSDYYVDPSFTTLCRQLYSYGRYFKMPIGFLQTEGYITYQDDGKRLVCFNGGKVSLACALRMKNTGQDVILFYVKPRNKHDEEKRLQEIADKLEMPLVVCPTLIECFDASPFKNMMVLNYAIDYAVENKHSLNIVYGTFTAASISVNSLEDYRNCIEWMNTYSAAVRKIYPDFKISMPMPGYNFVWDELLHNRQFVQYIRCEDETEEWILYIAKVDHNLQVEKDKNKYILYIKRLKRLWESENNKRLQDIHKLWNRYFFYRIEKSKHYGDLMNLLR